MLVEVRIWASRTESLRCSSLRASPEFHTKVWPRWTNPGNDSARVQPSRINQVIHNALGTGLQFFGSPLCVISGNSSNLRQVCVTGKCTGQLAEQSRLYPPIDRVAVRACPASPVVSTLIKLVPCPSMIRPADTVQLYTGEILLNGPVSTALKVTG